MSWPAINRLFQFAESPTLLVNATLANDTTAVLYLLVRRQEVIQAVNAISANPQAAEAVLERIRVLLSQELPLDEMHRYDAAIASYVFVLSRSDIEALHEAAQIVRDSRLPNLHWAYAMVNRFVRATATVTETFRAEETGARAPTHQAESADHEPAATDSSDVTVVL